MSTSEQPNEGGQHVGPPSPYELWNQALAEHPDDREAMRNRYRDLLIENMHLVPRQPYEGCEGDESLSGVDQADPTDPAKVWRCDACGAEGTTAVLALGSNHRRPDREVR